MFVKVSDHLYIHPHEDYTDRPNMGLVVGENCCLLFEAGNSSANVTQLMQKLEQQNLPEPDFVAVSHWHWDHSFGMHAWEAPTIAGAKTNEYLKTVSAWKWDDASMDTRVQTGEDIVFCNEMIKREFPNRDDICVKCADITFDSQMNIDLGGVTVQLISVGGPHADDSVVCFIPEDKYLLLGDSSGKDLYGKPWHFDIEHEDEFFDELMAIPYDMDLVQQYLQKLQPLDFDRCISGHGEEMTKAELWDSFPKE